MISYSDFEKAVVNELGRDIRSTVNADQNRAINSSKDTSLFIVAGPGSGKTTVIVLKVLKFIFVDNIEPSSILATTFTRKAASELKSRVMEWGNKLKSDFMDNPKYFHIKEDLNKINFKNIILGTIDSISEDALRNSVDFYIPYTVIEDFVSSSLMIKVGLLDQDRQKDRSLKSFLNIIRGSRSRLNISMISQILLEIKDRIYHDRMDFNKFISNYEHPGAKIAHEAIYDYIEDLKDRNLLDFSMLEDEFLRKIQNGELDSFLENIKIVLIDEYQDTNLLQETIYFEIAKAAIKNKGSIIVVGDDDQSLYRFRGATVDLFKDFKDRVGDQLSIKPIFVNLSKNYRSTKKVVNFCNEFVYLDRNFQDARVSGKKSIVSSRIEPFVDFPVLGMFRGDINTLAKDLAEFINKIVYGDGFNFKYEKKVYDIEIDRNKGSPADISLLCSSPLELDFKGNPRLSHLLKDELSKFNPQIPVFNPRGQNIGRVNVVELLCGTILECIDPAGSIQEEIRRLPRNAVSRFNVWRKKALNYIKDEKNEHQELDIFLNTWKMEFMDKKEISLIELIYKIIKWVPEIQDDEGLIYLEVIIKTIEQTSLFSDFKSNIILDPQKSLQERNSIIESLWNVFVPIALGAINIDLDILEDLPKNRVNVMSIHQAKGLEFPIVIVDVGSDFKMNYARDSFKRFPGTPGKSCTIEDNMREFSLLGKPKRDALDRAFDDIIRQYFVAFSRSQNILLLVGLNSVKEGYYFNGDIRFVPNMATGWDRNMNWHWNGLENLFHI
ncbi:UvrD-helicase domain-containing protein [Methanobacterium oryzae]|uniref:UvrD-helicase domain-containing protein n=1 Tax=Methanobacterium oryzae TaxID=69540 RepID=UPI003D1916BC